MKFKDNITGVIVVNKPSGPTSRDIVNIIQKKLNTKAGHAGTLDPLASGVLVVTLGKATKLSELLMSKTKEYEAKIMFGLETDTLDKEGIILKEENAIIEKDKIIEVLENFKKTYMQEVPKYSAVKVNGKKLYEYARNNIDVVLPKKEVTIFDIKLLDYKIDNNKTIIKIYTKVSKGTYIRSLIRDIAEELNTVGTMTNLVRTSQGKFSLNDAYTLDDIENNSFTILNINETLDIPVRIVDEETKFKIINGAYTTGEEDMVLFVDENQNNLAIYKKDNGKLKIWKMLYNSEKH